MRLQGRLPTLQGATRWLSRGGLHMRLGDQIEVDVLLFPNAVLFLLAALADVWAPAWKFMTLWVYYVVNVFG